MEVWKDVEGFVGYKVSSFGNVIGLFNRVLKPTLNTDGYYIVGLHKDNKKHSKTIHRLLAIAFIPNPENKPTVDHIDRNPLNNALSNLRWATHSEQQFNKHHALGISGEKHIYKRGNSFVVQIPRKVYYKTFKTKEEAIEARDLFLIAYAPCDIQEMEVKSDPPTTKLETEVVDT